MKKIVPIIIVLVIIGAVIWKFNSGSSAKPDTSSTTGVPVVQDDSVPFVPASEVSKVSEKLSLYKNDELGFSVKYPTPWVKTESAANVTFNALPVDNSTSTLKTTVTQLQASADVFSGKCSFPPVVTVKERSTLKVGSLSFNMISISNTVQGISYFNRMYSLQKDSVCYFFGFSAVTASPTNKGLSASDAQKVGAKNKTLVDTADAQFRDMVKSFAVVVGPAGQDEATVSPKK